jgi:hypothetical protein
MRVFFSIVIIVIWQSVLSQTIDLSSENSIREFLNDKEIKVGEYGTVQFTYEKYNREFGSIDFKVLYRLPDRAIPLKANIMIRLDDFSFPKYVRTITLSEANSYTTLNINAPTIFQFFENGEIYYQEKTSISMAEYINSITSGKAFINSPTYKLCN